MITITGQAVSYASCCLVRFGTQSCRMLLAFAFAAMAGCAAAPEVGQEPPLDVVVEPESKPEPEPPVVPEVTSSAQPPPEPPPRAETPRRLNAAIVLSNRMPAFENVARELELLLHESPLYNLADRSQPMENAFAAISSEGVDVVIAIGLPAAEAAMAWSTVPVIYCQVFNFKSDDRRVPVKGVASIPPLAQQIEAWKQIDPDIQTIGAILGQGHENLVAEAMAAASANGVSFQHRVATSDRETLYLFQRMAPGIDGFWLFPDNRVLSPPVLEQMTAIASRHRVRIAVFNDALLEIGASVSTAAKAADIAATVVAVAMQVAGGAAATVPPLTPLNEISVRAAAVGRGQTGAPETGL